MRRKKYINIIIAASIIIFLFCIYFSKTIKNVMLPSVTTISLKSGTIGNKFETDGIVKYENTHKIYSGADWNICELNVKINQPIKKGDILGKVNNEEITLKEREIIVEIMKLKEELKTSKADPKIDKDKLNEIQYEIETNQLKCNEIRKGLDNNGNIISNIDGTVININNEHNSGTDPAALFEVIDNNPGFAVTFDVPSNNADKFLVGSSIEVFSGSEDDGKKFNATISQKNYDSEKDMYTFLAQSDNPVDIKYGDKVTVNSTGESKRYDNVIPKSCLTCENGLDYIYVLTTKGGALGEGFYVQKVQVQVVASDDANCAITEPEGVSLSGNYEVVLNSSKPISNNCEVKLDSKS